MYAYIILDKKSATRAQFQLPLLYSCYRPSPVRHAFILYHHHCAYPYAGLIARNFLFYYISNLKILSCLSLKKRILNHPTFSEGMGGWNRRPSKLYDPKRLRATHSFSNYFAALLYARQNFRCSLGSQATLTARQNFRGFFFPHHAPASGYASSGEHTRLWMMQL